ncbi:MAG: hypothetical protein HKN16_08620 [Saprospiraceae bacterium]|nr:hypothetical protein [Saprospiraceae bacterium]
MALVGVGILSAAEAFVDAHLKTFDVSEDLSVKPFFNTGRNPHLGGYTAIGLKIPLAGK